MADSASGTPRSQIGDYALIGDCETAALVDRTGSIDWLCWPRFDSDACFAALLGDETHGRWQIAPVEGHQVSRRYRPGGLVLETLFETETGAVALLDFMPPRGEASHVVRIVEGRRGRVALHMQLVLRFGYGATAPWLTRAEDGALRAIAGPCMAVLRTPVETRGANMTTVADFAVDAGDHVPFVLSYQASHMAVAAALDPFAALEATDRFWATWLAQTTTSDGPYAEAVERSLITLKAMTFAPTGALVAAPTTSLPEQFGGERNWDYRYSWIRDSTLTLLAMINSGYLAEATAWLAWLQRAVAGDPADMQIMYGVGGERRLLEWTADWLPGHEASQPVRIGNAAHEQFQLDVYGELMDTFHQARLAGLEAAASAWELECVLVNHVAKVWNTPDNGIWEVRGPRRAFTYSRIMAWVAVDRAIKSSEAFGLVGPVAVWRELRETIRQDIWAHGFDRNRNTFTQSYGAPNLDASLLLMAQVGFIDPMDPGFVGTVEAIERDLLVDGFVLRYRTEATADGLSGAEGAFLPCSFWLADAYAMIGRRDDARALFERLLSIRNDLGLLAEEYDVKAARFAGNFPQAFSHIGLVNTAANLGRSGKPMHQRAANA